MDAFLTNYYWEKDFFALQSSFALINILLRYHDPELSNWFDYIMVKPGMYATSWILTVFSNKMSLSNCIYLWDKLIIFKDQLLIYFIIVAFLLENKEMCLNTEISNVPAVLSNLSIESTDEIDKLFANAIDLSYQTPYSFRLLVKYLNIFEYHSNKLEEQFLNYSPDTMLAMPIFSSEVLKISYKSIFNCADNNCDNFYKPKKKEDSDNNNYKCTYCLNEIEYNQLSYIVLDFRISEDYLKGRNEISTGVLPQAIRVDSNEILSNSFPNNVLDKFIDTRGNYHFMLITSKTKYFMEYENDYYIEDDSNVDSNLQYGIITKEIRTLNMNKVNHQLGNKSIDDSIKIKLKEFDNLKKVLQYMINNKIPYVSYVFGGFDEIHSIAKNYNIELIGHTKDCFLCKKGVTDTILRKIKKIGNKVKHKLLDSEQEQNNINSCKNILLKDKLNLDDFTVIFENESIIKYLIQTRYDIDKNDKSWHNRKLLICLADSYLYLFTQIDDYNYNLDLHIHIKYIANIIPCNRIGNVITICYNQNNNYAQKTVDFLSEIDAKDFKNNLFKMKYNKLFSI